MQVIIVFIVYSNNYIHLLIIIYIQTNCLVLRNKKNITIYSLLRVLTKTI